jgi:hypothetical protein
MTYKQNWHAEVEVKTSDQRTKWNFTLAIEADDLPGASQRMDRAQALLRALGLFMEVHTLTRQSRCADGSPAGLERAREDKLGFATHVLSALGKMKTVPSTAEDE